MREWEDKEGLGLEKLEWKEKGEEGGAEERPAAGTEEEEEEEEEGEHFLRYKISFDNCTTFFAETPCENTRASFFPSNSFTSFPIPPQPPTNSTPSNSTLTTTPTDALTINPPTGERTEKWGGTSSKQDESFPFPKRDENNNTLSSPLPLPLPPLLPSPPPLT